MAEYIERNSAVVLLRERGLEAGEKIGPVFANGIFDAVRFLGSFPAADVAPVVHGRWIPSGVSPHNDVVGNWECSECGDTSLEDSDYCPNCGAVMDKEADDAR